MTKKYKYGIKVRHYGEGIQVMNKTFRRKWEADQYLHQQAKITEGYEKSYGWIDGAFVIFGEEGIHKTTMWLTRIEC